MKQAFSYQRWSTVGQGKEGRDSRIRQTNSAADWMREHGTKLGYSLSSETFTDAGKSGFSGKTLKEDGELKRFLSLVESGKIKAGSILLIDEFSRFSRMKPTQSLTLFLRVISAGIGLVFTGSVDRRVIDPALLDTDPYVLQFIIGEMIRSHAESAEKSRKIKSAKASKREAIKSGQIVKHNGVPKYFSWDNQTKRYVHNDNTPLIVRMVNDYLAGKSLYAITKALNQAKIPSQKVGCQWSPKSIRCILESRKLIGEYLGNPSFFSPIVDQDTFDRLQVLLKQNTIQRGRVAVFPNVFRGLAFCECGQRMNISSRFLNYRTGQKLAHPYRYFRCSSVDGAKPCAHRFTLNMQTVEEDVFGGALLVDPKKLLAGDDSTETRKRAREVTAKQADLNRLTKEIAKLVELSASLPMDELKSKLGRLENERQRVKTELDSLNLATVEAKGSPGRYDDLKALFEGDDLEAEDAANRRLIETLKDHSVREQLRVILPSLISKIVCNATTGRVKVFNVSGAMIFESLGTHQG